MYFEFLLLSLGLFHSFKSLWDSGEASPLWANSSDDREQKTKEDKEMQACKRSCELVLA